MARMSQTRKQQPTQTIKDVLSDAVKSPSQDAIAEYKRKQALKELEKTDPAQANVQTNLTNADSEANAVLAEAMEIGEALASHPEFVDTMRTAIQAKEDDEYKSIATLKWMEKFLSTTHLSRLPWPGSTKGEAEAMNAALPPTKRVNMVSWDHFKSSGSKGTTSYYKTMVRSTPMGKEAFETKERLEKEAEDAAKNPEKYPKGSADIRDLESKRANRSINQMLSALRTAAKIRLQMDRIGFLKNLSVWWVRSEYEGEEETPKGFDPSRIYVVGLGDVIKSTQVIRVRNNQVTKDKEGNWLPGDPEKLSVGQFLRWKISDDMVAKGWATLGGEKGLIASAKKTPETGDKDKKTGTLPTARDVHNWTELHENMNAQVSYLFAGPEHEQSRWLEFQSGIKATDDAKYTAFKLRAYLNTVFADAVFEASVKELVVARDKK